MVKSVLTFLICLILHIHVLSQSGKNEFSSKEDTLLISTKKRRVSSFFNFGGGFLEFQDTTNLFGYPVDYPDSLNNILGFQFPIDLKSELDYIDIISGRLPSGDFVVIVDQNNNHSFADDAAISLQEINWNSSQNAIPVTFLIFNGSDTVQRHSWIRMGHWNGEIIYGRDEYLFASISIDKKGFDVGIIDSPLSGSFTYGLDPQIAVLKYKSSQETPVEARDLIKMNEYLELGGVYYKFDSINNDGSFVRLIKEESFEDKIGIQVGMLAPEFKFKSTTGNTLYTSLLNDKPLIIANSCGCGGDTESSLAYFKIRERFQDEAYVLRLDSFSENISDEWTINMEDEDNKDSYNKFRQTYCSRVCYVVGRNRRILDKFDIADWEESLPKLFRH